MYHRGVLFRQHSSSSISTTSPLLSQDMSPTPSIQTTSLSGVQLNTLHQQHTEYKMPKTKCTNGRKIGDSRLTTSRPNQQFSPSPQQKSLASGNPEDCTLRSVISLNSLTSRTTAVRQWIPGHTAYMETKWPISWRKREARSSNQNPNLVTKK